MVVVIVMMLMKEFLERLALKVEEEKCLKEVALMAELFLIGLCVCVVMIVVLSVLPGLTALILLTVLAVLTM